MDILLKYFSEFTETQLAQFKLLGQLYHEWNEKINVISRKDIGSLYEKHVLHALSIGAVFNFEAGTDIIDIGTGGGFPGIPLAIFFPQVQFHLVDSTAKKLKVVEDIIKVTGLTNATFQQVRAEGIRNRKFHFAVSRAVAPLKDLWQWSRPLLKKGVSQNGLICLKGGDLSQEISESSLRPRMIALEEIFKEPYFHEKFLLYIKG